MHRFGETCGLFASRSAGVTGSCETEDEAGRSRRAEKRTACARWQSKRADFPRCRSFDVSLRARQPTPGGRCSADVHLAHCSRSFFSGNAVQRARTVLVPAHEQAQRRVERMNMTLGTSALWAIAVVQIGANDARNGAWLAVGALALAPLAIVAVAWIVRQRRSGRSTGLIRAADAEAMAWSPAEHAHSSADEAPVRIAEILHMRSIGSALEI